MEVSLLLAFHLVTLSPCHLVNPLLGHADDKAGLEAGFAEADLTPKLGGQPVWIAGFGHNRKASAVHDPILARAVVLKHGQDKIAVVSVDLVGLFHASAVRVRAALPGYRYVLATPVAPAAPAESST